MRASPFRRKQELPSKPEPSHLTLLDDNKPDIPSDIFDNDIGPVIRYVKIADKVFGITPETCYKGILANGADYFPYYDDDLTDATTADVNDYLHNLITGILGNNADRTSGMD